MNERMRESRLNPILSDSNPCSKHHSGPCAFEFTPSGCAGLLLLGEWIPNLSCIHSDCSTQSSLYPGKYHAYSGNCPNLERPRGQASSVRGTVRSKGPSVWLCPHATGHPRVQEEPTHPIIGLLALLGLCAASPGSPGTQTGLTTEAAGDTGILAACWSPQPCRCVLLKKAEEEEKGVEGQKEDNISKLLMCFSLAN